MIFLKKIVVHLQFLLKMQRLGSCVKYPFRNIQAANRIDFGKNILIKKDAWFACGPECKVKIGDNTRIGRNFIISGVGSSITIEENVLMSERVFITESLHNYTDAEQPVVGKGAISVGPVSIGADSWIGINVCIMPNVRIGKHCLIGANAVVTKNIPDFSIAAGVPAKVKKQYDFDTKQWIKVS